MEPCWSPPSTLTLQGWDPLEPTHVTRDQASNSCECQIDLGLLRILPTNF